MIQFINKPMISTMQIDVMLCIAQHKIEMLQRLTQKKCWSDEVKCFWPRPEETLGKHFQIEKVIENEKIHLQTLL